jgi:hypothetical protein
VKLPPNSFEIDGEPFNLPCTFYVFDKSPGPDLRFKPEDYKDTKDFVFGSKTDYDFSVLGASPTTVKEIPEPNNRGYYIKFREGVDIDLVKNNFRRCQWKGNSSASGNVAWYSQPEIVCQYRKHFEECCESQPNA